jgi:hypothetical protein
MRQKPLFYDNVILKNCLFSSFFEKMAFKKIQDGVRFYFSFQKIDATENFTSIFFSVLKSSETQKFQNSLKI